MRIYSLALCLLAICRTGTAAEPGTTRGIIDIENPERPADAAQLVGPAGYDLIPEAETPCKWVFRDGILTASPQWDSVVTRESYRDFRMHLEFNVNEVRDAKDPEKNGNSGVYIQQRYEVQILNSFGVAEENYKTSYCGSLYRLKKPDRLANKRAGEWQSFDIVFRAARFDGDEKIENARITVYQNQQLIHDDFSIPRKTGVGQKEGPEPRPIKLQGHHNPVRFRNVWIQQLSLDSPTRARHRFLLLDKRIVSETRNAKLAVGTVEKHKANPLFGEDQPWEVRFDNLYGNVLFDEEAQLYKCWYSPFIVDRSAKGMTLEQRKERYSPGRGREMGICYATSKDGLKWHKPALGLVEDKESAVNNLVWRGPHGAGIFQDHRDPDPGRRYKALFQGLSVSFSADGLHWSEPAKCAGVRVRGDTHNNAFWAPTLEKYVGITRTWGDMGRQVSRIESPDFATWSPEQVVMEGLDKNHQTYAMPVFFHGGVYLGLVAIHEQSSDRVWTELAWSPDTLEWSRIDAGTPLIPCAEEKLAYDYGCVYACAYPVFEKNRIRLYYGGSDWLHTSWRNGSLCLATLRPDGFAGYEQVAVNEPAVITTSLIPYAGQTLQITADVAPGGSVKVIVLDQSGHELTAVRPVTTTVTDGRLELHKELVDEQIQLRFELDAAKLYSFHLEGKTGES